MGVPEAAAEVAGQRLRLDLGLVRRWLEAFRPVVETHDPLALFEEAVDRARAALEASG